MKRPIACLLLMVCLFNFTACWNPIGFILHPLGGDHGFQDQNVDPLKDKKKEETKKPVTQAEMDAFVDNAMATMSLEQKAGQLFLAICPEDNPDYYANEFQVGGYILQERDFASNILSETQDVIKTYRSHVKIPMIIAVEEEGGDVVQFSPYKAYCSSPFPSARELLSGGLEAVAEDAVSKAKIIKELGINVNLAPLCDVSAVGSELYDRAAGLDTEGTSSYVAEVVKSYQNNGIDAVLKYFPGYANNMISNQTLSTDTRSLQELEAVDIPIYTAGIDAGARCIMMSHLIVPSLDKNKPVSLSKAAYTYVRQTMGFQGVLITQDLEIEGILTRYNYHRDKIAIDAILAGADMVVTQSTTVAVPGVIAAVKKGTISQERLDASVKRILKWKISLGLIDISVPLV